MTRIVVLNFLDEVLCFLGAFSLIWVEVGGEAVKVLGAAVGYATQEFIGLLSDDFLWEPR